MRFEVFESSVNRVKSEPSQILMHLQLSQILRRVKCLAESEIHESDTRNSSQSDTQQSQILIRVRYSGELDKKSLVSSPTRQLTFSRQRSRICEVEGAA